MKQFLKQAILTPRSIGAVIPSSRFLAEKVVSLAQAGAGPETVFIELGPGTGAITQPLLKSKRPGQRIIMIEKNSGFLDGLRLLTGSFELLQGCVSELEATVDSLGVLGDLVLVSSIPWLSLPTEDREKGQRALHALMRRMNGVRLIQYTYTPQSPLVMHGCRSRVVGPVLLNFPPAWIWVYTH